MNGTVPADVALGAERAPATEVVETSGGGLAYALLYLPFGLAWVLAEASVLSYLVAWAGSFWILFLTITGRVKRLPVDRSLLDQVMRPIVLTQLIFVGYNFVSSIFFFLDVNGYYYIWKSSFLAASPGFIALTAEAQRLYVLAHAGIATGMLAAMDYRRSGEWAVRPLENPVAFLLVVSAVGFGVSEILAGGLGQIGERLSQLGLVASVLALALAFPTRRGGLLLLAAAVYGMNLVNAFLTGFKENVLVMVILLAVFAYPYARKTVLLGAPIALIFLLAILPTYANVFRSLNWSGNASAEEAAAIALETIQSGEQDIAANNWAFLTGRISEIGMFNRYISSVEASERYYGTSILEQTVMSLVPRALWSDKPVTETLVMERAIENGIVSRDSEVSAKPQYVVDSYLSFGTAGMLLGGLLFGLLASGASRVSERFFGGYFWGTGLVYTSFFSVFWKGNSFEFFFNTALWSFILLIPLFYAARSAGVLVRREDVDLESEPDHEHRPDEDASGALRGFWAPQ